MRGVMLPSRGGGVPDNRASSTPELGNVTWKFEVYTAWGVNPNAFNVQDSTIQFLQNHPGCHQPAASLPFSSQLEITALHVKWYIHHKAEPYAWRCPARLILRK